MGTVRPRSGSRRPGRPRSAHSLDARRALIEAARELFSEAGFDGVSTKRLAESAGVNPAMIHYYFGDKAGLHEAAFREGLAPLVERLSALSERTTGPASLPEFFHVYMRTVAANPWLPRMIVRDVLPEGGRLRPLFVQTVGSRVGPVITGLVAAAQARGEVNDDLDPLLTTLSVVSLAVFPFLAWPVASRILDLEMDDPLVERLVEHTVALFYHGAGARP